MYGVFIVKYRCCGVLISVVWSWNPKSSLEDTASVVEYWATALLISSFQGKMWVRVWKRMHFSETWHRASLALKCACECLCACCCCRHVVKKIHICVTWCIWIPNAIWNIKPHFAFCRSDHLSCSFSLTVLKDLSGSVCTWWVRLLKTDFVSGQETLTSSCAEN